MPGFDFVEIQLTMNSKDLKFLVLGAGAIGGITAAALKRKGFDVEIICKYDDYATLISTQGIDVQGVHGSYNVKVPAYATPAEVKEKRISSFMQPRLRIWWRQQKQLCLY